MRVLLSVGAIVICSACVAVSNTSSTSLREPQPGEVKFDLAGVGGAAMVVPVTINGQGPFPFILDTGATLTCLDTSLAEELALEEVQGVSAVGGTVTGLGAVKLVEVPSVEVGTARGENLRACVLDLGVMGKAGLDARGLLGLNFMKPYRLTIDFDAQVVRFDAPDASAATQTK